MRQEEKREKISEAVGNIGIQYVQEAGCYDAAKRPAKRARGMWGKVAVAATVLLCAGSVCLCMPSSAVSIGGFYQDIVRWWDGAIVGTEYENATEEIQVEASSAVVDKNGKLAIPLTITLSEMGKKEPYRYLADGEIALGDYQIIDASGVELYAAIGQQEAAGELADGAAVFLQPAGIETLAKGTTYTLVIDAIYGLQKAEQPLKMSGHWECQFTVGD